MNHLKDQSVLILGLGISGLAMARWCVRAGARVTVADTRPQPPQLAVLQAQCPEAAFIHGAFDRALMEQAPWQLVARSPGLAPTVLKDAHDWAVQNGVPFWGELDLFAAALSELGQRSEWPYNPKVLGITGTNGKTTVTSLTGLLLERCGLRVAVAGNIGPALLDVLSESLDAEAIAQEADRVEAARLAEEAEAQAPAEASAVKPDAAEAETGNQTDIEVEPAQASLIEAGASDASSDPVAPEGEGEDQGEGEEEGDCTG